MEEAITKLLEDRKQQEQINKQVQSHLTHLENVVNNLAERMTLTEERILEAEAKP